MKINPITIFLLAFMIAVNIFIDLHQPRANGFYIVIICGLLLGVVVSMWKSSND